MRLILVLVLLTLVLSVPSIGISLDSNVVLVDDDVRFFSSSGLNYEILTIDNKYITFNDTYFAIESTNTNDCTIDSIYPIDYPYDKNKEWVRFKSATMGSVNFTFLNTGNNKFDVYKDNIYYCTVHSTNGSISYTDYINGEYTYSIVCTTPNWDINIDRRCTIIDLIFISNLFNSNGNNGWVREDVDNDGNIRVLDLVITSNHFQEQW